MFSFLFVRGVWHQLSVAYLEVHSGGRKQTHCLLLLGKIKTQQSAFETTCLKVENWGTKSRQLTTRVFWSGGGGNHSNHTDSEEIPRIFSLLVNRDARVTPRLHSPFHQAKPVEFLSCAQAVVSYTIWWEKLEAADGKLHPQRTRQPPSHFQGWEWERAVTDRLSDVCPIGVVHKETCMRNLNLLRSNM